MKPHGRKVAERTADMKAAANPDCAPHGSSREAPGWEACAKAASVPKDVTHVSGPSTPTVTPTPRYIRDAVKPPERASTETVGAPVVLAGATDRGGIPGDGLRRYPKSPQVVPCPEGALDTAVEDPMGTGTGHEGQKQEVDPGRNTGDTRDQGPTRSRQCEAPKLTGWDPQAAPRTCRTCSPVSMPDKYTVLS